MGWKILLPQELKKDARDLLESHGHTLIDGRGFETEDVIADMKEHKPDAIIVRITKMPRAVLKQLRRISKFWYAMGPDMTLWT